MEFDRRPLMAGNWKMFKTQAEAVAYVQAFKALVAGVDDRDVLLAAPFTALGAMVTAASGGQVMVAAETMHYAAEGAYTGEVAAGMLTEIGVSAVILGHSERRQYFAENDPDLAQKVRVALDAGLLPVLCCGETDAEREAGRTESKIGGQVDAGLSLVQPDEVSRVAVAYEPIWAIGTGKTATAEMAQETIASIRARIGRRFAAAATVRILYGGSVKSSNIDALMAQPDIDGVLVGGASLDPSEFARIVKFEPLP
jgi:triosephosphate isomerase (TIM)